VKGLHIAAERLAQGSCLLARRMVTGIGAWLKAGEGVSDFMVRVVFLGIPVVLVWGLLSISVAFMWVVAFMWIVAAWRAVAQPAKGAKGGKDDGFHPDDVAELLDELMGESNVHLSRIRKQLDEETGRRWSDADVRKLLEAAGIQTRHSVRVPGQGVAVGVHRADMPSPSPTAIRRRSRGPEEAGQPTTATATPLTVEDIGGGAGRVIRHPGEHRQYAVRPQPKEVES
jgi:hypothetical protein